MDLKIAGRTALITASSQGLGRACATALIAEGVDVVINGRYADKLAQATEEIQASASQGASCRFVTADLSTEIGVQTVFEQVPETDILVTNNRGPKPAGIETVTGDDLAESLQLHYYVPVRLLQHYLPGMRTRKFGRVVNITSKMVDLPMPTMLASTGARSAQTAVMQAIGRESVADNVTVNQLIPMIIDSPRQIQLARLESERTGEPFDAIRQRQGAITAAQRLGRPDEFGAACAFLCSEQAGYISGGGLRVDGGGPAARIGI